jgi:excisionase family DNA binding protein
MVTTRLLRPFEAQEALGISDSTLRRLVRAGHLPAVRIRPGARPRFRLEDVERLLARDAARAETADPAAVEPGPRGEAQEVEAA